jgi:predicted protein tyrosine phosphatase
MFIVQKSEVQVAIDFAQHAPRRAYNLVAGIRGVVMAAALLLIITCTIIGHHYKLNDDIS